MKGIHPSTDTALQFEMDTLDLACSTSDEDGVQILYHRRCIDAPKTTAATAHADNSSIIGRRKRSSFFFWCRQQGSFPHGANMCTTACLQVGMAVLCRQLDLAAAERDPLREEARLLSALNWCMNAGNVVQGRVEGMLNRGCGLGGLALSNQKHHMLSINDIIRILGINLASLRIGLEEMVVCRKGENTPIKERHASGTRTTGAEEIAGGRPMLKYEPCSCFITLGHIPECMQLVSPMMLASQQQHHPPGCTDCSVAIITAHGHSVLSCCYYHSGDQHASYSFFDPLPGKLAVGLTSVQLCQLVRDALRIPSSACGTAAMEGGSVQVVLAEDAGMLKDGIRKRSRNGTELQQKHYAEDAAGDFYADVTILHIMQ
jgi:hypothetical protein